jgi:hypothetical protein
MSHPGAVAHGVTQPLIESWTLDPWVAVPLALVTGVYLTGWLRLHAQVPLRFGPGRLAAFLGGLTATAVALASPLYALGAQLLQAHMVQHLLLMMVAPPLIWLGAPLLPLLHGLPRRLLRTPAGRLFASPRLTRSCRWLVHPAVAWVLFVGIPGLGIRQPFTAEPSPQRSGTTHSTPAFSPPHLPSGGQWCSPGRANRWSHPGPSCSTWSSRTCRTPCYPPGWCLPSGSSIRRTRLPPGCGGSQRSTIRRRRARSCGCRGLSPSCCPSPGSSGEYSIQQGLTRWVWTASCSPLPLTGSQGEVKVPSPLVWEG